MKKALISMAAIFVIGAVAVFAAFDTYDSVTVKTISTLKSATGTQTNTVVDLAGAYKGVCNFIAYITSADTNAANFGASATLTHCATSGGTYAVVTNGAGSAVTATCFGYAGTGTVTSIKLESENLLRYVKLVTVSTNDTCDIGAVLLYSK